MKTNPQPKATVAVWLLMSFFCIHLAYGQERQAEGRDEKTGQPELFLPGIVSTHLSERDAALSDDGQQFYYSVSSYSRPMIVYIEKKSGRWTQPQTTSFSGVYSDLEPHFSPDGKKLYFASNRPLEKGGQTKDFDIWYVERTNGVWGEPVNVGFPVNTPANEFFPSVTDDGTIYWCAVREGGPGGEDIFFSRMENGQYGPATALSDSINTAGNEYNAFVARDESYIIFTSNGWGPGYGRGDLWISFRRPDGQWTRARNMGQEVNTPAFEYCPFVSADGKSLFFTSDRVDSTRIKTRATYEDVVDFSNHPGNKQSSIFTIDAGIIERLRPRHE
jgi:Tol biopolymer transport system component